MRSAIRETDIPHMTIRQLGKYRREGGVAPTKWRLSVAESCFPVLSITFAKKPDVAEKSPDRESYRKRGRCVCSG